MKDLLPIRAKKGRKFKQFTQKEREEITTLLKHGNPVKQIASLVGIEERTIAKHFASIIQESKTRIVASLRQKALSLALEDGNDRVLLKCLEVYCEDFQKKTESTIDITVKQAVNSPIAPTMQEWIDVTAKQLELPDNEPIEVD